MKTWPDKPTLAFFLKLKGANKKEAFMLCDIDGIEPTNYAHLLPQKRDAAEPPVHNETNRCL